MSLFDELSRTLSIDNQIEEAKSEEAREKELVLVQHQELLIKLLGLRNDFSFNTAATDQFYEEVEAEIDSQKSEIKKLINEIVNDETKNLPASCH
jgi:hypothetical protein